MSITRVGFKFSILSETIGSVAQWPFGTDGALIIDGVSYSVGVGTTHDFSSVLIKNGGALVCDGASSDWTIVGCRGDFTMLDTARVYGVDSFDEWYDHITGAAQNHNYSALAPDGTNLSYTIIETQGGDGGSSYSFGGSAGWGCGGGGDSNYSVGQGAIDGQGGAGGDSGSSVPGGDGGLSYYDSESGGPGQNGDDTVGDGCGGGGGGKGSVGKLLYLKVGGNFSVQVGAGFVFPGHDGGVGGDGSNSGDHGGSGGGGGAGGWGGYVIIKIHGTSSGLSGTSYALGGAKGSGGAAGAGALNNGNGGIDGENGANGDIVLSSY